MILISIGNKVFCILIEKNSIDTILQVNSINVDKVFEYIHNAGVYVMDRKTNGRDRTKAYLQLGLMRSDVLPTFSNTYIVRPYKRTLGIWYFCKRTITYNFSTAVDIHRTNGTYLRAGFSGSGTQKKAVVRKRDVFSSPNLNDVQGIHYAGYDCTGSTPSAGPVIFSKYTNNL